MSESEKLQKVLARAGHGSRREIEGIIKQGRISVDGKVANLGDRVNVINTTRIRIDGRIIAIKPVKDITCRVLVYYKPQGESCTRRDSECQPTVFDHLQYLNHNRWIAIRHLNINTSGLQLFTTDGELANRLMQPSCEIESEYAVRVFGEVDNDKKCQLTRTVQFNCVPAVFRSLKFYGSRGLNQWYNVTLIEGRNQGVQSLLREVGLRVSRLIRIRYGNIVLPKWLSRGNWIELSPEQTNFLRKKVQLPLKSLTKSPFANNVRCFKKNTSLSYAKAQLLKRNR